MVKITFEIEESLISEMSDPSVMAEKVCEEGGGRVLKGLMDVIGFSTLGKYVKGGKKEFTVNPDRLDDKSKALLDSTIGEICVLAAFSEMDKKED